MAGDCLDKNRAATAAVAEVRAAGREPTSKHRWGRPGTRVYPAGIPEYTRGPAIPGGLSPRDGIAARRHKATDTMALTTP